MQPGFPVSLLLFVVLLLVVLSVFSVLIFGGFVANFIDRIVL